ncbi:MAG: carboxymuconolactone decarboxylase family protein [Candidatus Limnocylindria bacterium]
MQETRHELGLRTRREVLGDEHVDRARRDLDDFSREFDRLLNEYCWGATWSRSGITRRQRSLITLALLAALNRPTEFETHVRAALRNGCTPDELRDTLIHIAVYAGVPAGFEAFRIARRVLQET